MLHKTTYKYYRKLQKAILLTLPAVMLFSASCDSGFPDDCFKNTGKMVWEERTIAGFNKVKLQDNVDLFIYNDSIDYVKVYAGENLIDKISTSVNDSVLQINNYNICNWVRDVNKPVEVHLYTNNLKHIEYRNASGNITTIDPLTGPLIELRVREGHGKVMINTNTHHARLDYKSGTADVFFSGEVDYFGVFAGAYGMFDSREMNSRFVYINQMSNNDVYTYARDILSVEIHLFGNIFYTGNPEISIQGRFGEGNVLPL